MSSQSDADPAFGVLLKEALRLGVMKRPVDGNRSGWSQAGLADALGVDKKTISNYTSGRNLPSDTYLPLVLNELTRTEVALYREIFVSHRFWSGPDPASLLDPKPRLFNDVLTEVVQIGVGREKKGRWDMGELAGAIGISEAQLNGFLTGDNLPDKAEFKQLIKTLGGGLVAKDHALLDRLKASATASGPQATDDTGPDFETTPPESDEREAEGPPPPHCDDRPPSAESRASVPWAAITGIAALAAVALAVLQVLSSSGDTVISSGGGSAVRTGDYGKVVIGVPALDVGDAAAEPPKMDIHTGDGSPVNIGGTQVITNNNN